MVCHHLSGVGVGLSPFEFFKSFFKPCFLCSEFLTFTLEKFDKLLLCLECLGFVLVCFRWIVFLFVFFKKRQASEKFCKFSLTRSDLLFDLCYFGFVVAFSLLFCCGKVSKVFCLPEPFHKSRPKHIINHIRCKHVLCAA